MERQKKRKEGRKGDDCSRVQLILFSHNMIIYIENPKETTIHISALINVVNKIVGYHINMPKLLVVIYPYS